MRTLQSRFSIIFITVIGLAGAGCSGTPKSPDVASGIRTSLNQAGLKDVSVSQDRDKGVVTLNGKVASETERAQAESIAGSMAAGQVVANQVAVVPAGLEHEAGTINSDLDKGIESNLHAVLVQNRMDKAVNTDVKNGVITLSGEVGSPQMRADAERVATGVPYVRQVVNELQVKNQKATSSN